MRKPKKMATALSACIGAVAFVLALSSPANATVQDVNFEGDNIHFTFVQANQVLSCSELDLAGEYDDLTRAGVIDQVAASDCDIPWAGPGSLTPRGVWHLVFGANVNGSLWEAEVTNIVATVALTGCTFDIAGAADGEFDTSSQELRLPNSNVQISTTPTGFLCPLFGVGQGQDVVIDGTWVNTGTPIALP